MHASHFPSHHIYYICNGSIDRYMLLHKSYKFRYHCDPPNVDTHVSIQEPNIHHFPYSTRRIDEYVPPCLESRCLPLQMRSMNYIPKSTKQYKAQKLFLTLISSLLISSYLLLSSCTADILLLSATLPQKLLPTGWPFVTLTHLYVQWNHPLTRKKFTHIEYHSPHALASDKAVPFF